MANPDADTEPPQFSVSLAPTSSVCHLNGEPRFGFKLQILSHVDNIITICLHQTPLKELHSLEEIAYVTNKEGEEVEWPWGIGCWEYDLPFPDDLFFEDLEPGVPYERMFWLNEEDPETAQGDELGDLEAGREYKVKVSEELLGSFWKWRRGEGARWDCWLVGTKKKRRGGRVVVSRYFLMCQSHLPVRLFRD
jgi:hypothetical protein